MYFAKEAGNAEYKGLPGKIRTGCPNTPDLKSRFCSKHRPTTVTPQCSQPTKLQDEASQGQSKEQQEIIIDKETTRQSTIYEVCTFWKLMNIVMWRCTADTS